MLTETGREPTSYQFLTLVERSHAAMGTPTAVCGTCGAEAAKPEPGMLPKGWITGTARRLTRSGAVQLSILICPVCLAPARAHA